MVNEVEIQVEAMTASTRVQVPPPNPNPFLTSLASSLKETFFPDDPFKQFHNQPLPKRLLLTLHYFVPIFQWAPRYTFHMFKSDFISGITIASLAVPQGISYAGLASLPPVIGLYSSFVPPLVYAMLGSSRDLAVGTVAVPSLLISSMLGKEVDPHQNPKLYVQLVLTATFFAGVLQATLGLLRLGFLVDLLSHATIVGFMGGAATVVALQQLKAILGLVHFTDEADLVSVTRSVFSQMHKWRWESGVLGCCFLFFLGTIKHYSKKKKAVFFWANALAPLSSVILGSLLVYIGHAESHGVEIIGDLKRGLNPASAVELESAFSSPYLSTAIKTGVITGIIALAEGIAVGRSFATFKSYHIDGNKEMVAIGMMNIAGSCTSCYLTTGSFSRTAVNFNSGCKTAVSNIVMAAAVMITLLFLTPLFHYTPLVVLSAIIMSAMVSLIDYKAAIHLWTVDKFDFVVCVSAYTGVVFGSVEIGLVIAVVISLIRILVFVARPRTSVMGSIPNSMAYRNVEQYSNARPVPGILILRIDAPIYFANANYLRERIMRWIDEEEEKQKQLDNKELQYIVLDMSGVGSIDTSGISALEEIERHIDRRCMKLVLANPGGEVMKKLEKSNFIDGIGKEWILLTIGEAVNACNFRMVQTSQPKAKAADIESADDKV